MTFTALGGPHVADLCSPPLEVVQDSRLERVTQVGASAGIEGRNKPGVGRVAFFSRVAAALTFGVSGNRHGARQERVREMAPRIGSLKMLPAGIVASPEMLPAAGAASCRPITCGGVHGHECDAHGSGGTGRLWRPADVPLLPVATRPRANGKMSPVTSLMTQPVTELCEAIRGVLASSLGTGQDIGW